MRIRPWQDEDLDAAVEVATLTHKEDAYPVVWPRDPGAFVAPPGGLGAWAAVSDTGDFSGQVRLRPPEGPPVAVWASGTGEPVERLGVVARLFVAPSARRSGVGRRLLATAVDAARELDLVPVLDVLVRYHAARRLYEAEGWEPLGSFVWPMPDGSEERARAYWLPQIASGVDRP